MGKGSTSVNSVQGQSDVTGTCAHSTGSFQTARKGFHTNLKQVEDAFKLARDARGSAPSQVSVCIQGGLALNVDTELMRRHQLLLREVPRLPVRLCHRSPKGGSDNH